MNGLLLINVGTPDAPDRRAVRRYLREFLSDPEVMDIGAIQRWLLLNLFILPFRTPRSARAYAELWTDGGSPLLRHSRELASRVAADLGSGWRVRVAMRYGSPSIAGALDDLRGAGRIVVLPLYPQRAASTTGTAVAMVRRLAAERGVSDKLVFLGPFFEEPGFVEAASELAEAYLRGTPDEHVLFSFHGLPVRHIRRADRTGTTCLSTPGCCDSAATANPDCYRFQCFQTARAMAASLQLGAEGAQWSVAFQSRMGRTPWIGPFTEESCARLALAGVRRLVVVCPSFVADCLETIEEIGVGLRRVFLDAGGEEFSLVPCVNSSRRWAGAVGELAQGALGA